ncbi:MAG: PEFG-CTERM sorting domain-containing protein, partial [Nitrosopumilus sp.]|nr:PEFG-CTERM sorting domain-containing protein [Nitrosopumilus sp.]NNL53302.1 PEFG-CTERM sorting domain-containing protein [Nitrosopumilus sp.]
ILIDEIEVAYEESKNPESRVLTINFEQGDSDIEIIGTYVVPEFSTIAVMILIIGIMTTIVMTRNKIQIKI